MLHDEDEAPPEEIFSSLLLEDDRPEADVESEPSGQPQEEPEKDFRKGLPDEAVPNKNHYLHRTIIDEEGMDTEENVMGASTAHCSKLVICGIQNSSHLPALMNRLSPSIFRKQRQCSLRRNQSVQKRCLQ